MAGSVFSKSVAYLFDAPHFVSILPPPFDKGGAKPSVRIENPVRVTVYGASPSDYLGDWRIFKPSQVVVEVIQGGKKVVLKFSAPKDVDEAYVSGSATPVRLY